MDKDCENKNTALHERRRDIDVLDEQLLHLINERARIVFEIAGIKRSIGRAAYDGGRERQILARIREENAGPLPEEGVINIFCAIIRECRRVQETIIGYTPLQEGVRQ